MSNWATRDRLVATVCGADRQPSYDPGSVGPSSASAVVWTDNDVVALFDIVGALREEGTAADKLWHEVASLFGDKTALACRLKFNREGGDRRLAGMDAKLGPLWTGIADLCCWVAQRCSVAEFSLRCRSQYPSRW